MTSLSRLPWAALFGLAGLLSAAQAAPAGEAARAEVRLSGYRLVPATGKGTGQAQREPLKDVSPGDTVEYEASYVNGTDHAVKGVRLTVPVPAGGLELIASQQGPLASSASLDGNHFAPLPLTRIETLADGRRVVRDVPLAEYRALRWDLGDVPAGATRQVRARMQLPALSAPLHTAP